MYEELYDVRVQVNGQERRARVDPDLTLLEYLRDELGLTGTKCGCGYGTCGACTVLLDDTPVRSCMTKVRKLDGQRVQTIEGLAGEEQLDPVQTAFLKHGAYQCGFCTPGMIMEVCGFLASLDGAIPQPADVRHALRRHICRCGSYQRIVAAVIDAAGQLSGSTVR